MIITQQKSTEDLFAFLEKADSIVLLGCSECATICKTGGKEQLMEFEERLKAAGKKTRVLARLVLSPACNAQSVKKGLKSVWAQLEVADAALCFSCGDGTQTVVKQIARGCPIPVYPGNDTLFLGETVREGEYVETCRACGQCELGWTGGICPVTRCAKGLLNGPCGGSKGRMCEVHSEDECVWLRIYDRLDEINQLDNLLEIRLPRDHLKNIHPRSHRLRKNDNVNGKAVP